MFEYTRADIAAQLASLPPVFFIYLRTLAIINLSSVFLIWKVQARWVLGAMLFIMATNGPIFLAMGLVKIGSLPHLIVWVPLVWYLANQLRSGKVDARKPFGWWCMAVMLADLVSVVFDVRDTFQYILGDRGSVLENLSTELPIPTLIVIVITAIALIGYALGVRRSATDKLSEAA